MYVFDFLWFILYFEKNLLIIMRGFVVFLLDFILLRIKIESLRCVNECEVKIISLVLINII